MIKKKILIAVALLIAFAFYELYENINIDVKKYTINTNKTDSGFEGFKIAQVSDLHLKRNSYVKNEIIKKIKKEHVDVIVITGDLIDSGSDIYNCGAEDFCRKLSKIAPVYAISGNHEATLGKDKCMKLIAENNVNVIDDKCKVIKKDSYSFELFGTGYFEKYNKPEYKEKFINDRNIKIVLSHRPDPAYSYCYKKNSIIADVVLSGHAHGGQFVIPFTKQGLWAPNQGFMPWFTDGRYNINNSTLIVSRGLGNSHNFFIRINNRIHLPIIIIK